MSATQKKARYIIGIDEAGRGPLAGPVVVAGIRMRIPATTSNAKFKNQNAKFWKDFRNIRDSKKLTARQREEWFQILTTHPRIEYAVSRISPKIIDKINVYQATLLGARRVYKKLQNESLRQAQGISLKKIYFPSGVEGIPKLPLALLDGGLKLEKHIPQQTIIKGDEKIPVISAASIIAKVTRDRLMRRLHKKYPQYGFDRHKGYGTKLHRAMLVKYGRCDLHRRTFRIHET